MSGANECKIGLLGVDRFELLAVGSAVSGARVGDVNEMTGSEEAVEVMTGLGGCEAIVRAGDGGNAAGTEM